MKKTSRGMEKRKIPSKHRAHIQGQALYVRPVLRHFVSIRICADERRDIITIFRPPAI